MSCRAQAGQTVGMGWVGTRAALGHRHRPSDGGLPRLHPACPSQRARSCSLVAGAGCCWNCLSRSSVCPPPPFFLGGGGDHVLFERVRRPGNDCWLWIRVGSRLMGQWRVEWCGSYEEAGDTHLGCLFVTVSFLIISWFCFFLCWPSMLVPLLVFALVLSLCEATTGCFGFLFFFFFC